MPRKETKQVVQEVETDNQEVAQEEDVKSVTCAELDVKEIIL